MRFSKLIVNRHFFRFISSYRRNWRSRIVFLSQMTSEEIQDLSLTDALTCILYSVGNKALK